MHANTQYIMQNHTDLIVQVLNTVDVKKSLLQNQY